MRNKLILRQRNIFIFCLLLVLFPIQLIAKHSRPLIWDMVGLEQMKKEIANNNEVKDIITAENKYCDSKPIVIINERVLSFAPNNHYYCSLGPYMWPDSVHPGQYIAIDGKTNPDSRYYDNGKLSNVATRCEKLSQAYYFTHDKKYYNAFVSQLKAWFLDGDTYMLPNFEYAQVRTKNNIILKDNSTGMVDAYYFNTIIESIRLVDSEKRVKHVIIKGLQQWFLEFASWAESKHGYFFREKSNQNISVAYDVTMVNMYLFAGKPEKAKGIVDRFAERRILKQIKEDGSQPEELKRPIAFEYSIYNLTHFLDFCYLARYWDTNYYSSYGDRIDKAFSYLEHYLEQPELFPYQKLSDLKRLRIWFNKQNTRRKGLRTSTSNVFE